MKKTTFLIVGKHAVLEALKNPYRKIERVFLTEDAKKKLNRENQSLNLFKTVSVFFKSRKELDNLCGRDETAHQGLVAEVEQLEEITLKEFVLENKSRNINLLALEEVTDPRNIGSIIRSAVAFDIDGLIVKERHFPSESKLLYKSASGCVEHLNIFQVSNINTTLKYLREQNFWVYGFEANIHYHPHILHNLHFHQSYSFLNARNLDQDTYLTLTPANKIKTSVNFDVKQYKFLKMSNISLYHMFVFNQDNVSLYESPSDSYNLLNFELVFNPFKNMTIVSGIKMNLKVLFNFIFLLSLDKTMPVLIPDIKLL